MKLNIILYYYSSVMYMQFARKVILLHELFPLNLKSENSVITM